MFFTQEDFRKIEQWLLRCSTKDSELPFAGPMDGSESVAIVQGDRNKRVPLYLFIDEIKKRDIKDFYNVTAEFKKCGLTYKEAIDLIPVDQRKIGMVITYLDTKGNWKIIQFKGTSVYQWDDPYKWGYLFEDIVADYVYHPDEEDITSVQEGNRKLLKLKDRKYEPDKFSGKGRIILRRNLIGTEDCSLDDEDHYENIIDSSTFTEPNTVYVIRYDFKLKENIKMPPNCELHFEGGSISGGSIDLNGCKLLNLVGQESDYFKDTNLSNWATGQIEYRGNTIKCWDGAKWVSFNTGSSSGECTCDHLDREEIIKLIEKYMKENGCCTGGSGGTISREEIISIIDEYLASLILWKQL